MSPLIWHGLNIQKQQANSCLGPVTCAMKYDDGVLEYKNIKRGQFSSTKGD